MKKNELLMELRRLTSHLPQEEADRFTQYYSEIISDAMEDGMSEEEAVLQMDLIDHDFFVYKDAGAPELINRPVETIKTF